MAKSITVIISGSGAIKKPTTPGVKVIRERPQPPQ